MYLNEIFSPHIIRLYVSKKRHKLTEKQLNNDSFNKENALSTDALKVSLMPKQNEVRNVKMHEKLLYRFT
jgi:hypothetical protein